MIGGPARRLLILAAAMLIASEANRVAAGPRPPKSPPALILATTGGRERLVEAVDLTFASFERIYHRRRAAAGELPQGPRVDVESRRRECACVRLADWSRIKFKELRQIEIEYPRDGPAALLRLTRDDGSIQVLPAERLYGAGEPLPPRFVATVDGVLREYRLIRAEAGHDRWPDERLVRILLQRPAVKKRDR